MKIISQGGFSAVEGLLILIIVGIIGGTGWYVMNANNKTSDTLNNSGLGTVAKSSKKTSPTPVSQADPTTNWATYSDMQGQYSFKYPSNWTKNVCNDDSAFVGLGPTVGTAGHCQSDAIAEIFATSIIGDERATYLLSKDVYPNISTETVTVNGVEGTKQSGIYKVVPGQEGLGPSDGAKTVGYTFYKNGRTYVMYYTQNASYPDVLSDFDLMVTKTLKFYAN